MTPRTIATALLATFTLALPAAAKDDAWKDQLRTEILKRYPAKDGGAPGAALVLQQDGIVAETMDVGIDRPSKYPITPIRDGSVVTVAAGRTGGNIGKRLTKGERVRLLAVQINDKKPRIISTRDSLTFRCEGVDCVVLYFEMEPQTIQDRGTTTQVAFRGVMRFEFPVAYLATAPLPDVIAALNRVVRSEQEVDQAPAPTVKLGQTPAEVQQILGKPERIMDLGPKNIFVYKDMKVIFIDGKVSDVQ